MSNDTQSNDAVVVTSETLQNFNAQQLGWATEPADDAEVVDGAAEEEAIDASANAENAAAGDEQEDGANTEADEAKQQKPKSKLEQRMSELTQRAKNAEARALAAEEKLKNAEPAPPAKVEPTPQLQKAEETPGKPKPGDFTDAYDYAEKLAEWAAKDVLAKRDQQEREREQTAARQKVADSWKERQEALKTEVPDYMDTVTKIDVVVSDEVRDAIVESDVGPRILYHLAKNPEEAKRIAGLSVGAALKAIGRLEAQLEPAQSKTPTKVVPQAKASNAPEPIKPLKTTSSVDTLVNSDGEYTGTYDEYKRDRLAGKIK